VIVDESSSSEHLITVGPDQDDEITLAPEDDRPTN